jgi:hypothetical protein
MSAKANPTDAKTIALYYLNATTDGRNTPAVIAKTINQVKNLMNTGYTKDEILATIDAVLSRGIKMYSFGYLSACIADVLNDINKGKTSEEVVKVKEELKEMEKQAMEEVNVIDESTERNRNKLARLQSRKREKHPFDMFEGQ